MDRKLQLGIHSENSIKIIIMHVQVWFLVQIAHEMLLVYGEPLF